MNSSLRVDACRLLANASCSAATMGFDGLPYTRANPSLAKPQAMKKGCNFSTTGDSFDQDAAEEKQKDVPVQGIEAVAVEEV